MRVLKNMQQIHNARVVGIANRHVHPFAVLVAPLKWSILIIQSCMYTGVYLLDQSCQLHTDTCIWTRPFRTPLCLFACVYNVYRKLGEGLGTRVHQIISPALADPWPGVCTCAVPSLCWVGPRQLSPVYGLGTTSLGPILLILLTHYYYSKWSI